MSLLLLSALLAVGGRGSREIEGATRQGTNQEVVVLNSSLDGRPGSIILVEADGALRKSLVKWLRGAVAECTVLEAATKEQAAIVAQSEPPSMIVVDISCPYIDGEETVREIKRAVPWAAVVALTMCDDRGYCDQLLSAGADESMLIWESRAELPFMIRAILARDSQMQERNKDV